MSDPQRYPELQHPHSRALSALRVGQTYTIAGLTAHGARTYIFRAKRGTSKWFEARTLSTGACIKRIE